MSRRKLLIRDLTLRDGQQSLFATRMTQEQVDRVLPFYKDAGFYAMEVWGGAVPDSIMRYLHENPWARLEKIKKSIGGVSKLTALSRGRNLFGYNPYPDEVIEGFNRNAVKSGIGIMRIFDALNDVDNMKSTIRYVKESGGMADCAISFTVDPKFMKLSQDLQAKNKEIKKIQLQERHLREDAVHISAEWKKIWARLLELHPILQLVRYGGFNYLFLIGIDIKTFPSFVQYRATECAADISKIDRRISRFLSNFLHIL